MLEVQLFWKSYKTPLAQDFPYQLKTERRQEKKYIQFLQPFIENRLHFKEIWWLIRHFKSSFFSINQNINFMQKFQAIIFALTVMSFTGVPCTNEMILETKIYGTCGCENAVGTDLKIELTINPDHSFHYRNASNPSKKVDVKGNWSINGNMVVLQGDAAESNFHKTWKFDKKQPCIMSRKGLYFIRLCDIESYK